MTEPRDFPDVEALVPVWLEQTFEQLAPVAGRPMVGAVVPDDLQALDVFVSVRLVTGTDDTVTDFSVLDIDVLSKSRDTSYDLARDIRSRFTGQSHRVNNVVIDGVRTEEKPRPLPWADANIWRYGAVYRISARRA